MGNQFTKGLLLAGAAALIASEAYATEGYFTHGSGARNKAMAGAGIADTTDATAMIINPAGMAANGNDATISVSLFSPRRKFTGAGTAPSFTPNGEVESSEKLFAIPNLAYVRQLSDNSAMGVSIAANGGMNTNYRNTTNPTCQFLFNQSPPQAPADNGVFCGGTTGVNLSQALISIGYSHEFSESFRIGLAPIFAYQMFEATGLQAFGFPTAPGFPPPTSDPANLTNNGIDTSTGFGGKAGFEFDLSDQIRVGGAYQSKIKMSKFDKYAGLFANQGDFDIPESFQVGLSFDASDQLSVSVDYRRINYSGVPSVGNPQIVIDPATQFPLQFGTSNGPGFGWKDVDAFKVGAEWRPNDQWSLRAGYAHNSQPIEGANITLNILAPGVVQDHFTAGGEFALNDRHALEFAAMYAPTESVSGIEVTPQGPNPGHTLEAEMKQYEFTIGWKIKFGN